LGFWVGPIEVERERWNEREGGKAGGIWGSRFDSRREESEMEREGRAVRMTLVPCVLNRKGV
jgi:hypothetical protein